MELRLWQPHKRPAQDHVPAHVRKIWLARECFTQHKDTERAIAAQQVLHASQHALVLRGTSRLRTRQNTGFSSQNLGSREPQFMIFMLWVPFHTYFRDPPAVSIETELPYDIRTEKVARDGFQIVLHHWGEIPEEELELHWKAAGFPEPTTSLDTAV